MPPNTTATVYVPASSADLVTENGQPAKSAQGVEFVAEESGRAVFNVKSGDYRFAVTESKKSD